MLSSLYLSAQQTPQYSLYMLNPFAQNPAYAGMENTLIATGTYRNQWLNLPGAPVTQKFNAHMPLSIINSGIGIQLENESIGAFQRTALSLAYNYQLNINRKNVLSFGLSGGLKQQTLDGSLLRTPEGSYDPEQNIIIHNDNLLPTGSVSTTVPTFTAGLFFQAEKYEIGLGVLNLLETTTEYSGLSLRSPRSYYLSAQYTLGLSRTLTLTPSILVKSDAVLTQAEASALIDFKEKFLVGISYRGYNELSQDAIIPIVGFTFNENWTLAYSYDITLSSLGNASSGSHEILLKYDLGRPIGQGVPPPVIFNPRF